MHDDPVRGGEQPMAAGGLKGQLAGQGSTLRGVVDFGNWQRPGKTWQAMARDGRGRARAVVHERLR